LKKTTSAVRILEFDAAHRVANHESKCATLHGHRYKVEAYATAKALDEVGRVIDFSVIKAKLGEWIDLHWDHTTLIWKEDKRTLDCVTLCPGYKHPFVCDFNPTAENMAIYLLRTVCPKLFNGTGVQIVKIRLWETPNCYVEEELMEGSWTTDSSKDEKNPNQ